MEYGTCGLRDKFWKFRFLHENTPNWPTEVLYLTNLKRFPHEAIPRTYAPTNQGELGYAILEGIPEISLGTEHRIKNIEDTIRTRDKLATLPDEDIKRVTQVPSNFTANYLLHNRYEGEGFEASDTGRYIDVKHDMSQYNERKYDVCNDNSTR